MQESAPCMTPGLPSCHRLRKPAMFYYNLQPKMVHQSLKEKIPVYFRYSLFDTIEREGGVRIGGTNCGI